MTDIVLVTLSYLKYYHEESKKNPHYTTEENIKKQMEIIEKLTQKGGIGLDEEVAINSKELVYFYLK